MMNGFSGTHVWQHILLKSSIMASKLLAVTLHAMHHIFPAKQQLIQICHTSFSCHTSLIACIITHNIIINNCHSF